MNLRQPNFHDIDACKRRAFNKGACLAECLACGDTPEQAERAANRLERAHELKEDERVRSAIERLDYIKSNGRNPPQRYWR